MNVAIHVLDLLQVIVLAVAKMHTEIKENACVSLDGTQI